MTSYLGKPGWQTNVAKSRPTFETVNK